MPGIITTYHHMPDNIILGLAESMSWSLRYIQFDNTSEFNGEPSLTRPVDRRWQVEINTGPLEEDQWGAMIDLIDLMDGVNEPFSFWIPYREVPIGKATGIGGTRPKTLTFSDKTTFSDGTAALGPGNTYGHIETSAPKDAREIHINGLERNTGGILRQGDMFSIWHGDYNIPTLYKVIKNARSDNNGMARVRIAPALRYPVADGDVIDFYRPRGIFKFAEQPQIIVEGGGAIGSSNIVLTEAYNLLYEADVS